MFSRALLIQGAFDKKTYGEANNCQIKKEERELVNEGDKNSEQQSSASFNPEMVFESDKNTDKQIDSLQQEQSGARLVKKRIPPKK